MKSIDQRPVRPLDKYTVNNALDQATAHLLRADYQFGIPGPRQRDHWESAITHLKISQGALVEALNVLEAIYVGIYGPILPPKR